MCCTYVLAHTVLVVELLACARFMEVVTRKWTLVLNHLQITLFIRLYLICF